MKKKGHYVQQKAVLTVIEKYILKNCLDLLLAWNPQRRIHPNHQFAELLSAEHMFTYRVLPERSQPKVSILDMTAVDYIRQDQFEITKQSHSKGETELHFGGWIQSRFFITRLIMNSIIISFHV